MGVIERFKNSWNLMKELDSGSYLDYGSSMPRNPDSPQLTSGNERSIITSVFTQIAVDVSNVRIEHARVDEQGQYLETIMDSLNDCLTKEANLDQAASAFRIDQVLTLCDKGVIAICPMKYKGDPLLGDSYEVLEMRVGEVLEWFPKHVKVRVYDDETGKKKEIVVPKRLVAIVENPLSPVMNGPNSTLQRLIRKLNYLDRIDDAASSGKLDLLIQLPYSVKTDTQRVRANKRRSDIEVQLKNSKYGIAYIDSTEGVTQLNRPAENNLLSQIEYLTKQLYNQLGVTEEIFAGTASEAAMLNYQERTVKPIIRAIVEEMDRKFLSKTARTQGQKLYYFRDPFSLVPVSQFAEIVDKLTRNEVATSNEMRSVIGFKRVTNDPNADKLRNSNLSSPKEENVPVSQEGGFSQNESSEA